MDISLSERDLVAMLEITRTRFDDLPAVGFDRQLLERLFQLVECDMLSACEIDPADPSHCWDQELPASRWSVDPAPFWEHYWDSPHCSYPDRTGDTTSVTMLSDFCTPQQHHDSAVFQDYLKAFGVEHELMVVLPLGHQHSVRLLFSRGEGTGFSERDRAVLQLLRPHLGEILRRSDAARRGVPDLTPRQWELMRLVAGGYTNRQIARRLVLSEATVRKHLENVFQRLDVTNRTAAIAGAFPDRLGA